MITIIVVASAAFAVGTLLFIFFGKEKHLLENFTAGRNLKGPAWNVSSAVLAIELDTHGDIGALVYCGSARNPGSPAGAGVVRRWERDLERPGQWLSGVTWEHAAPHMAQLPFVRSGDALIMANYGLELSAVDMGSGETLWRQPLPATPAGPLLLEDDGNLLIEFEDDAWMRVNPADGREVTSGQHEQRRDDRDLVELGKFAVQRIDTRRAILGNAIVEVENPDFADDDVEPSRCALIVTPASAAYGGERHFPDVPEPPPGRHVLDLSGRIIISDVFAVGAGVLVFLAAQDGRQEVDLYAEMIAIDDLRWLGSLRLGSGSRDAYIEFANAVQDHIVLRVAGMQAELASSSPVHVTCVLAARQPRLLARLASDGQPIELLNVDSEAVWSGVI